MADDHRGPAFEGLKKISTESLSPEFEKILHDNLWDMLENTDAPPPVYNRWTAIELLVVAGYDRIRAIEVTRNGPESVKLHIERHPDRVFSEWLCAAVGAIN